MSNGDPHLQTIDGTVLVLVCFNCQSQLALLVYILGLPFDYFGIGLFASCYSIPNGFGVQLMFFKYKHASMVGGAALRIGGGVATVTTTQKWDLPRLRYCRFLYCATVAVSLIMTEADILVVDSGSMELKRNM